MPSIVGHVILLLSVVVGTLSLDCRMSTLSKCMENLKRISKDPHFMEKIMDNVHYRNICSDMKESIECLSEYMDKCSNGKQDNQSLVDNARQSLHKLCSDNSERCSMKEAMKCTQTMDKFLMNPFNIPAINAKKAIVNSFCRDAESSVVCLERFLKNCSSGTDQTGLMSNIKKAIDNLCKRQPTEEDTMTSKCLVDAAKISTKSSSVPCKRQIELFIEAAQNPNVINKVCQLHENFIECIFAYSELNCGVRGKEYMEKYYRPIAKSYAQICEKNDGDRKSEKSTKAEDNNGNFITINVISLTIVTLITIICT